MNENSTPSPSPGERSGVIYDLGYRGYDGPRLTDTQVAWSLFCSGLGHAYGIGRTGKAKLRPWALLGAYLMPAVVLVGILGFGVLKELPMRLPDHATQYAILVCVFAAVQAPVVFGRDLRYRSIVLYLARPLSARVFALMRYLSMAAAVWLFMFAPVLLLYLGGLLSGLDTEPLHRQFATALLTVTFAAFSIAGVTGVISSWTVRPGLAVVAAIAVLLIAPMLVFILQAIPTLAQTSLGELIGVISPFTLAAGIGSFFMPSDLPDAVNLGGAMAALYACVGVAGPAVAVLLIQSRFRKAVSR